MSMNGQTYKMYVYWAAFKKEAVRKIKWWLSRLNTHSQNYP